MTTDQENDAETTTDRSHPSTTRRVNRASNRAVGMFLALTPDHPLTRSSSASASFLRESTPSVR